jgi:tetratricopeptide (TPR) repeat protein
MKSRANNEPAQTLPLWALAIAGLAGIVALFYFGYDQDLLVRVTLGLTAAGVASCLPGLLSIKSRGLTAGGALGVFVLVMFADDFARMINPATKVPGVSSNVQLSRNQMQYQSEIAAAQFEISNESYDNAIEILHHAQQLNPKEPLALHMIGQIYFNRQKKFTAAAEAFKKGYDLGGPDKGRFAANLALAYDAIGSSESAKKWIQIAFENTSRETYPTLWDEIVYDRGLIYLVSWFESGRQKSEDFQQAAESFNMFLDHRPKSPHWANYHLACMHAVAAEHVSTNQGALAKATGHFNAFLHEIKSLIGDQRVEDNHKIARRVLALKGDKTDRGPLEPVECPAIREMWDAKYHNWTTEVEPVFSKSSPTAQPPEKTPSTPQVGAAPT